MKRLLWIGNLESEEEFKNKAQKGYSLASAQVSQNNILKGIEKVTGLVFDSINGSVLPPYPDYQDRVIQPVIWYHKPQAFDISVGYKNLKYVNRIACKKAMIKAARDWVQNRYKGEELIVLSYSMRSPVMGAACEIKKLIPTAKIYLIITDLPQFMDLGQSKIKQFLKIIDGVQIRTMQKHYDGFILYAAKMAEYLKIPDEKWMLMEGLYDLSENQLKATSIKKKRAIMYSGKLDVEYGVNLLLDAFIQIKDEDAELWLTGAGNAESYIKDCEKIDSRIKYYGFLPSREDVLNKQKESALLINMRLPSENASAYCFPSKILEYMATGVPTITFKLDGIPEEYYKYLITVPKESLVDLKYTIENGLKMTDKQKNSFGYQAKKFVLTDKSILNQCQKINEFIGD